MIRFKIGLFLVQMRYCHLVAVYFMINPTFFIRIPVLFLSK